MYRNAPVPEDNHQASKIDITCPGTLAEEAGTRESPVGESSLSDVPHAHG